MSSTTANSTWQRQLPKGWWRWVPALHSLRRYSRGDARADVLAGLSVATVAVPQAMAYALVAGVAPEYGLYTAIIMTAIGAFFDSSRQLINGPTNAIAIAVFSVTAPIATADEKLSAIILLALMIGVIQTCVALLRWGDVTRYISHSVIVGFTAGASILLVFDQMKNLLGKKSVGDVHDHFLVRFWHSMVNGGDIHASTLYVGLATIGLVLLLRWAKKRVGWVLFPELLFTVVVVSAATYFLGLDGVVVIGTIPAKLPSFQVPDANWSMIRDLAPSALAIGTLGLLEAISMAKSIAATTRQKIDLNQQCLSEGLANLGGGFFQCMPGSGSLTRSAINTQAGAVTQWSGIVSAAAVALIVVLFAPYAQYIPKTCLAGILIMTGLRMIDPKALRYHMRASRFDMVIVLITAFSAVVISVEFCVMIGVFLSFMLAVPRAGRMLLTEFTVRDRLVDERLADDVRCSRLLIFGLEGEMFFGSVTKLEEHFARMEQKLDGGARVLVLRLKRVRSPDAVCMRLLNDFTERMHAKGVHVILCGVRDELYHAMQRTEFNLEVVELFREQKVRFSSTLMAVRRAYEILGDDVCPHCPRRTPGQAEDLYYMV